MNIVLFSCKEVAADAVRLDQTPRRKRNGIDLDFFQTKVPTLESPHFLPGVKGVCAVRASRTFLLVPKTNQRSTNIFRIQKPFTVNLKLKSFLLCVVVGSDYAWKEKFSFFDDFVVVSVRQCRRIFHETSLQSFAYNFGNLLV